MGLYFDLTPEQIAQQRKERDDYRCRYCGHTAKSVDWQWAGLCVNWTTKHRHEGAFPLCPKCKLLDTIEIKKWDADDSEYRVWDRCGYKIIRNEEAPTFFDYAPDEGTARKWYENRRKEHPDDLYSRKQFTYRPERRYKDED